MSQIPFPLLVLILAVGAVLAAIVIAAGPGRRGAGPRFAGCLAGGILLGAVLAAWVQAHRAAALASAAAGAHMSGANIRADGILGCGGAAAAVLFIVTSVLAPRRGAGRAPAQRPAVSRRRAGASR